MVSKVRVIYIVLLLNLFLVEQQWGQAISPFNKLEITNSTTDYSFIVSGHFHGSSTNISTFPASTLLANIDTLNSLKPYFLMSLGDLFLDVNDEYILHYQHSLFNKLQMPLLNAVGNHDLSNGNRYEKVYGKSFYTYIVGTQLFIVLNTEVDDGSIKGQQFNMFKTALADINKNVIKQVFIFSHRPIWSEEDDAYNNLFKGNTKSRLGSPNYKREIFPLLQQVKVPVYWISGSMGAGARASFFYDKDEKTGITFIQTAIRDTPRDAMLLINISKGEVTFKGISLTGEQLNPVESYNIDYWENNSRAEQSFNLRLLPYLIWLVITHHYFWIGFFSSGVFFLVFITLIKKWKRKK